MLVAYMLGSMSLVERETKPNDIKRKRRNGK